MTVTPPGRLDVNQAELDFQIEGEMDARKRTAGHHKKVSAGGMLKAWGSVAWRKREVRLSEKRLYC
jgi:hypothetical protein